MEFKKFIKNFIFFGSLNNTIISAGFLLVALAVTPVSENAQVCSACGLPQDAIFLEAGRFLAILLFSFIMSLGTAIFRINGIAKTAAHISHAACFIVGFLVFLLLCDMGFAKSCIGTAVFAIFYTIERVIQMLIAKQIGKNGNKSNADTKQKIQKKNEYVSQFK